MLWPQEEVVRGELPAPSDVEIALEMVTREPATLQRRRRFLHAHCCV